MDDCIERHALGGNQGESLVQIKTDLAAEDAESVDLYPRGTENSPGRLPLPMETDVVKQIEVLPHSTLLSEHDSDPIDFL
jgi:hypothetical protein